MAQRQRWSQRTRPLRKASELEADFAALGRLSSDRLDVQKFTDLAIESLEVLQRREEQLKEFQELFMEFQDDMAKIEKIRDIIGRD